MELFGGLQASLQLLLWLGVLAVQIFAFADALSRPARYWQAADINRPLWLALLGVSAVALFAFGPRQLLGIFGLAGIIATIVYLVDRRPKLQALRGTGGGGGFGGGGWRG